MSDWNVNGAVRRRAVTGLVKENLFGDREERRLTLHVVKNIPDARGTILRSSDSGKIGVELFSDGVRTD